MFLLQNAAVDGIWPLGSEGRHCRIRLRQGGAACFVSLFGTAPDDLPYRMGTAVDAAVEVSIFQGLSLIHILIRRLDRQNLFNLLQEEIIPPETAEAQKQPLLNRLLNKGGAGKHAKTNAAR